MKNILLISTVFLLLVASCDVETSQSSEKASKEFINQYQKGDYEAVYKDASIEMKAFVSKKIFLSINETQEKIFGKVKKAELQNKTNGQFNVSATDIYVYELKYQNDETQILNTEFLNGHLLRSHIGDSEWESESDFTKGLVMPIKDLMKKKDANKMYELLDKKYPLEEVESLVQQISEETNGIPSKYQRSWIDNDGSGKMLVGFIYAYEGKGYLDYRFYIEEGNYPFAGIFFEPDPATKLK